DDAAPVLGCEVLDRRDLLDARIVDQDIERTEPVDDRSCQPVALRVVGKIAGEIFGPAARAADLVHDRLGLFGSLKPVDRNGKAGRRKALGDRQPDSTRRAGHQRDTMFDVLGHLASIPLFGPFGPCSCRSTYQGPCQTLPRPSRRPIFRGLPHMTVSPTGASRLEVSGFSYAIVR